MFSTQIHKRLVFRHLLRKIDSLIFIECVEGMLYTLKNFNTMYSDLHMIPREKLSKNLLQIQYKILRYATKKKVSVTAK